MRVVFLSEFNFVAGDRELIKETNNHHFPYNIIIDDESLPKIFYDVSTNKTIITVSKDEKSISFWFKGNKNYSYGGSESDRRFYFKD